MSGLIDAVSRGVHRQRGTGRRRGRGSGCRRHGRDRTRRCDRTRRRRRAGRRGAGLRRRRRAHGGRCGRRAYGGRRRRRTGRRRRRVTAPVWRGPEPPPEHAARAATQAHAKKTRPEGDGIEFASRSPAREACRADVRGVYCSGRCERVDLSQARSRAR